MFGVFASAFADVLTLEVLAYITLGIFIGYVVGAMPGMNRSTALALLLPFTYSMSPLAAISFLIGINKGGASGSAVSAILINVPGEPAAVVTTLDGYPMARKGQAQKALKIALYASVIGDLIATVALIVLAVPLAKVAIGTGPVELTAIMIFAITFIAAASGRSFWKGIIAGLLGLLLATPRLDAETAQPRLTFGFIELYDGIPLLAVAIGTLALSEVLVQIDEGWRGEYHRRSRLPDTKRDEDARLSWAEFMQCLPAILRSTLIGTGVGILPGLGASLSSFLAYTATQRLSRSQDRFGRGAIEGVASSEAADNASVPASLIPMFGLGIPGSLATALLMGAFMLHGLTPGPFLFRNSAPLVYGIFAGMIVASGILLVVGLVGQRFFSRVVLLPDTIILPAIVFFCIMGAYLEGGGMFSVYLMLIFAFAGYLMKKFEFSFVTFLIGYILGPMTELSLRQAIIVTGGDFRALLEYPVALAILALAVVSAWRFGAIQARSAPRTADRPGLQQSSQREATDQKEL